MLSHVRSYYAWNNIDRAIDIAANRRTTYLAP